MKRIFKIFSLAAVTLTMTACSSTNEPMIYKDFQPNKHDSFAKTTMRLAGSNKFVDSESGDDVTRNVTGSTAMKVGQLLMLDFVGAAQSAISQNMIEDEPLSKDTHFIVKVNNVDTSQVQTPELVISKAVSKLKNLAAIAGFTVLEQKKISKWTTIYLDDISNCNNLKQVRDKCGITYTKEHIASYNSAEREAYVVFQTSSRILGAHLLSTYSKEDIMMFHPQHMQAGTSARAWGANIGQAAVFANGKVNGFIKGATVNSALPISDLKYYYMRTKDGEKKIYQVNISDMSFTQTR